MESIEKMKRYKLKKDLPTFKAGEIFYIKEKGNLARVSDGVSIYSKKTMDNFSNILTDWFEEIPEEPKRWRAEHGQAYWFLDDNGVCCTDTELGVLTDRYRYAVGNYFKTRGEAESYKEYLIARQVLLDDAKGGKWKKDGINLYAYYDHDISEWRFYDEIDNIQTIGVIYFQDEQGVQKSLEVHKEQWEIVRKYEMGEM